MLVSKIDGSIRKGCLRLRERLLGQNVGVHWYQEWLFLCIFLFILLFVIQSALGSAEDTLYDENSAYLRGHVNNAQAARNGLSWEKQPLSAAPKNSHIKNFLADIDRKAISAAKKKEERDMAEKAAKRPTAAVDEAKASDIETKDTRSKMQTATQASRGVREEDLVNEVLKELPPETKGERDEWAAKQGVHRKEKIL